MKAAQVFIDKWMAKEEVVYIHTMEYYPDIKNEILPFATTYTDLENIMLSKISQRKTNTV